MKKLDKLVIKSFIPPLLVTFVLSMLVLVMQFLWKYIDDLAGKGLEVWIILKLLWYTSLTLVPLALPLTVLLASLMTFGNFGERYELVAIKSSGISLARVFASLLIFVTVLCGIAFVFSNNVYTYAFERYRTILHDVQVKKPALNITEGQYYDKIDGYVIRVGKKERDGKTIHDVQIYDHSENVGNTRVTFAKSGLMQTSKDSKTLIFTLYDGYSYAEDVKEIKKRKNRPFTRIKFDEQQLAIDVSSFNFRETNELNFGDHCRAQTISKLNVVIDSLYSHYDKYLNETTAEMINRKTFLSSIYNDSLAKVSDFHNVLPANMSKRVLNKAVTATESMKSDLQYYSTSVANRRTGIDIYEIEWHRKFSLSFSCLILFLIGAPLGAIIRKGGLGMPIVVSVFLFIAFYLVSIFGERYIITSTLPVWFGMWMSSIVFAPIGLFVFFKATTDAALLDADVWKSKIKAILKKIGQKSLKAPTE